MFKSLKEFLVSNLPTDEQDDSNHERSVELCAAVLMMEISLADTELHEDEHRFMGEAIQRYFHLDEEQAQTILQLARQELDHSVSLYEFTRMMNDTLTQRDKVRIVEMLWQVANADAVIDKYEEYYIRKIADLMYVSHTDFIKSKHKAQDSTG